MTNAKKEIPVIINIAHDDCMEIECSTAWYAGETYWTANEIGGAASLDDAIQVAKVEGYDVIDDMSEEWDARERREPSIFEDEFSDPDKPIGGKSCDDPAYPIKCFVVAVKAVYDEDGNLDMT